MSNINIDELLKKELGNLGPEPPADAWSQISSQVQAGASAGQLTNASVSAAKTATIGTKIILASAVVVTTVAGWVGYRLLSDPVQQPVVNQTPAIATPVEEAETAEAPVTSIELPSVMQQEEQNKPQVNVQPDKVVTESRQVSRQKKPVEKQGTQKQENPVTATTPDATKENRNEEGIKAVVAAKKAPPQKPELTIQDPAGKPEPEEEEEQPQPVTDQYAAPVIPNVFTPNNDGANDEFVISVEGEVLYDLKITDVRGNIVFESTDKNKHWNGVNMHTGELCQPGVYVFAFRYQLKGMNVSQFENGKIKLIR